MKERWKEPREGSEREPETLCLQTVGAKSDGVLFVERSGELLLQARLISKELRSRKETKSKKGEKFVGVDPKLGDLSMGRLKLP